MAAGEEAAAGRGLGLTAFPLFSRCRFPFSFLSCLLAQVARSLAAVSEPRTRDTDRWARHG